MPDNIGLDNQIPPEALDVLTGEEPPVTDLALTIPEEPKVDMTSYTVDAKFDKAEEEALMRLIKDEMSRVIVEYGDIEWFEKCEKADAEYNGLHEEGIDPDDPDIKLLLTTIAIDIISSRAYRQSWTPNPSVLMEAEYDVKEGQNDLFLRQDNLDYYLRNKSKLQNLSMPLYRAAAKYGATVLKTCLDHIEESKTEKKFYRPRNQKDIEAFNKKYGKKLLDPESKESKELAQLMSGGQPVAKIETDTVVLYHGAKHYRVDWKRFFARPSIKDFSKQMVMSEMFTYNYYEVEQKSGYWKEETITDIFAEYGDDYKERDYDFYESEVLFDRKGDGKLSRYLVTWESKSEKIARAIYRPYKKSIYTVYSIFEKDDSWIGYSLTERMADIVATANSTINSFVGEQALAHTPIIIANGKKVGDWTITLGKPNLLPMDSGNLAPGQVGFSQYRMESPSTDRIAFLQWIMMYVAILCGIDLVQSAGASDPQEKNPTNFRTQAKMIASTLRVEDMILTLQKSDELVAEQTEDIIYRFPMDYGKSEYSWFKNGESKKIDTSLLAMPVRYVMAGSRMSFDRSMDLNVIMQTIDFLAKFFPESYKDLNVRKALLTAVLSNTQGTVEKLKDILIKPFDKMIEVSKESEDQLKKLVADLQAKGVPADRIQGFLQQMMAGGGKPPMAQQQGMPPRPPQMGGLPPKPPIMGGNAL